MLITFQGTAPTIGPRAFVAANATLIGDVTVGEEANIWFSAVLRGDVGKIVVGARTNIQDGAVVHTTEGLSTTVLGTEVTVGHMALLHGCRVGNRSLIGMGSILLDNAEIAEECLVGAGSLVVQNAKFPPRSLILGRPAKVVRPLTDDEVARLGRSAEEYVLLAAKYGAAPELA